MWRISDLFFDYVMSVLVWFKTWSFSYMWFMCDLVLSVLVQVNRVGVFCIIYLLCLLQ